jgi:hypothetical protein
MFLGIDPGWKNLGLVYSRPVGDFQIEVIEAHTLDVSVNPDKFILDLSLKNVTNVGIERYVPYNGVHSTESENIVMLIGGLKYRVYPLPTSLFRAIDWKIKLCQILAKNCGFKNPSTSLDKKFSKAAAKALVVNFETLKDDHVCDAACISAIKYLEGKDLALKQRNKS